MGDLPVSEHRFFPARSTPAGVRPAETDADRLVRRVMDVAVSILALCMLLPLFALVALLIKADSPGPVFFAQTRCGRGDRPFKMLKFRTMTSDAERRLAQVLAACPAARAEYERHHKLTHDPRMTRLGRFLRRSSIDELPQLVNVLRGDMALTGPRPYLPDERAEIGAALPVILSVRPGLTGLWQISSRNRSTFAERVAVDCAYIRHRSLKMDVLILLATIPAVVKARGAS